MGRTVPSFRIVLAEEKQEWTPFKKALDKSERKEFDEMWDIPRLYVSACSNSFSLYHFIPLRYPYSSIITKSWLNAFLKLSKYTQK